MEQGYETVLSRARSKTCLIMHDSETGLNGAGSEASPHNMVVSRVKSELS